MLEDNIEYKGYTIEIHQDKFGEDPRSWNNLGKMICFHKRYSLGDKHNIDSSFSFWEELKNLLYKDYDALIVIPLYMYDHSGITIRTYPFSCPWDSGQIGFIYASKSDIRKEYSVKRISKKLKELVKNVLISEVETYDQFVCGDVYGYNVDDSITGEHVGSCYGFYGYDFEKNGLLEHAKLDINYHIEKHTKEIIQNRVLEIGI